MVQAMIRIIVLQSFLVALACMGFPSTVACAPAAGIVRVAVIQDSPSVSLRIKGDFSVKDGRSAAVLFRSAGLKTTVVATSSGIAMAGRVFKTDSLLVETEGPEAVAINARRFRGDLQFINRPGKGLLVVNRIELEDYIKGILYHEASHYWPKEALKAQAVACRTYALYQLRENAGREFDVTNDTYSQVYGGSTSERFRTNEAVEETRGVILTYAGEVFPAYYHATCAGHTEDASLLWKTDIPPLKGVACGNCQGSPHFNWHYVLSRSELAERLRGAGYKLSGVKGVEVAGRTASGRVAAIRISNADKELTISGKDLRAAIGPNLIRSTKFSVTQAGGDLVFEGTGWGHGVGMCQWGAYFMAKDGKGYQEILRFYYPQSTLVLPCEPAAR